MQQFMDYEKVKHNAGKFIGYGLLTAIGLGYFLMMIDGYEKDVRDQHRIECKTQKPASQSKDLDDLVK